MTRHGRRLGHSLGIVKQIAVGWALIVGMVGYTLLLGLSQMWQWCSERAHSLVSTPATPDPGPERLRPSDRR